MKRMLFTIVVCAFFNSYATDTVAVINHDPSRGYYVAFKYTDSDGNVQKNHIEVAKAISKIQKQPKPKLGQPAKVIPPRIYPVPGKVKAKGKIVYMGVYKEGTTRPSMFYAGGDEPIYSHKVTTDAKDVVFSIYGYQAKGFDVRW